jgi:hypothetical protein
LHYRVEATEIKVANFLQILASMHDALFTDSEEESAEGDPEVEGDDDQHPVTSPPGKSREEEMHEDNAKVAERNQKNDEHWSDGTTYIEEEPCPATLQPLGQATSQVSKFSMSSYPGV